MASSLAHPARADRPACPRWSDGIVDSEERPKEQRIQIACEDLASTSCRVTMVLKVPTPGPNLAVPETLRATFPKDWTWTLLSSDGRETASAGTSTVVGFLARGSVAFEPEKRRGLASIPEGCPGGRRTGAIFLRHPWLAVQTDRVARVPVVADSFAVDAPSEVSPWTPDASGGARIAEEDVGSPLRLGGPFVAAGIAAVVDDDPRTRGALRLRAGYELARPSWLVHSLAAESSIAKGTVRDFVLVPMTEVALASGWHTDVGFGVGVPIRIDDPAVGARFQVGLHFPVVGLLVSFDKYFGSHIQGDKVMGAVLQLSF